MTSPAFRLFVKARAGRAQSRRPDPGTTELSGAVAQDATISNADLGKHRTLGGGIVRQRKADDGIVVTELDQSAPRIIDIFLGRRVRNVDSYTLFRVRRSDACRPVDGLGDLPGRLIECGVVSEAWRESSLLIVFKPLPAVRRILGLKAGHLSLAAI